MSNSLQPATAIELLKAKVKEYRSLQDRLAAADQMMSEIEQLINIAPPDVSRQLQDVVQRYRAS